MVTLSTTKQIEVYISVGSNIRPEENIPKALESLKKYVRVVATSTFYRTMPIGRPEQPFFLNGVWLIEADRAAQELKFGVLRRIEEDPGRIRTQDTYAARTIDLDIALYGDKVIDEPGLVIPDPDIRKRSFIAIPLMELNPSLILPDTGETISSLDIAKLWLGKSGFAERRVTKADRDLEAVDIFTESLRERIKK
jgi:2-amino-4-hydroxy-6-hydroxymethyldihydropteridine diphosphokinase